MTGPDWLDGATRVPSQRGGTMAGGPPRFVWHTFEADPARLSAVNGARILIRQGTEVHFVLNPVTGELAQLLPASASGRGLVNRSGGVETNRMGTRCLQVEVIAFAEHPFTTHLTAAGTAAVGRLIAFARAHGIPDVWPAGWPPAYPTGSSVRSAATWSDHAGHYGHSQVPENDHGDPGALDVVKLFSCARTLTTTTTERPQVARMTGADMHVIRTPSNGDFLLTSVGRTPIDAGLAGRLQTAGMPTLALGAADTTALTVAVQRIVEGVETAIESAVERADQPEAPAPCAISTPPTP